MLTFLKNMIFPDVLTWYKLIKINVLRVGALFFFSLFIWFMILDSAKRFDHFFALLFIFLYCIVTLLIIMRSIFIESDIITAFWVFLLSSAFHILFFASIYQYNGISNCDRGQCDFLTYIYFSTVTWTTLGYGDFQPHANSRLFAGIEAFVGYTFMGLFIGIVTAGIQKSYSKDKRDGS
ncbi:MAG: hypothetical protein HUN04_20575 [Desulfobacter sp.]|nr:MAG: hypothetical protein HUN04_20575 [Desulfobacter sp.]